MIKVAINGVIFECQTPAEAVEIAKSMVNGKHVRNSLIGTNSAATDNVGGTIVGTGGLGTQAFKFLQVVKDMPAAQVSSSDLAMALDLKGPTGLGPRIAKMEQEFGKLKPPIKLLDEILEKEERPGQTVRWSIRPTARDIWNKYMDLGNKAPQKAKP